MNSDQPRFPVCCESMLRRAAELRRALERKFGRCRSFPEPRAFAPAHVILQPLHDWLGGVAAAR